MLDALDVLLVKMGFGEIVMECKAHDILTRKVSSILTVILGMPEPDTSWLYDKLEEIKLGGDIRCNDGWNARLKEDGRGRWDVLYPSEHPGSWRYWLWEDVYRRVPEEHILAQIIMRNHIKFSWRIT